MCPTGRVGPDDSGPWRAGASRVWWIGTAKLRFSAGEAATVMPIMRSSESTSEPLRIDDAAHDEVLVTGEFQDPVDFMNGPVGGPHPGRRIPAASQVADHRRGPSGTRSAQRRRRFLSTCGGRTGPCGTVDPKAAPLVLHGLDFLDLWDNHLEGRRPDRPIERRLHGLGLRRESSAKGTGQDERKGCGTHGGHPVSAVQQTVYPRPIFCRFPEAYKHPISAQQAVAQ